MIIETLQEQLKTGASLILGVFGDDDLTDEGTALRDWAKSVTS